MTFKAFKIYLRLFYRLHHFSKIFPSENKYLSYRLAYGATNKLTKESLT